jgi:hypothetical protein
MSLFRARRARPREEALGVMVALETGETLRGTVISCSPGLVTVELPAEPLLPLMDLISIRLRSRRDRFDKPFLARAVDWGFESGRRRYSLALDFQPESFARLPRALKSQFNRRGALRIEPPDRPVARALCTTPLLSEPIEGVVQDISAGGLGLVVGSEILRWLELIRRLEIQLTLPGEAPLVVTTQVRRHVRQPGDQISLGLMITESAAQRRATTAITRYVMRRQAEMLRRRIPQREIRR